MKDLLVIGAGQAGLSASYWLKKLGVDHEVWDAHSAVGDCWRLRWDSLHLFSPVRYNSLPGMPFPGDPWSLPDKNAAADYLADYAKRFELPIRTGMRVKWVEKVKSGFLLGTDAERTRVKQLVVATGAFGDAWIPEIQGEKPDVLQELHTSTYRNPADVSAERVLVVGAGASGQQLARELAGAGKKVWLAGPKVKNVPRKFLGKDVYWWLHASGVARKRRDGWLGKRLYERSLKDDGDLTVGECMKSLLAMGVKRLGKLTAWESGAAVFEDGERVENLGAVIWATGFRNRYDCLGFNVLDERGQVKQQKGVSEDVEGLYFVGLHFLHYQNSSSVGGVGEDARHVAEQIAAFKA